jgi:hypothetical protein
MSKGLNSYDLTFILTAAHTLTDLKNRTLFINLGIPYQNCSFMINNIWSDEYFDISYIEISTDDCEKYRKDIIPITLYGIAPSNTIAPKYRAAAIIDYPFKDLEMDEIHKTYEVKTTYILSQMINIDKWPNSIDKSKTDFMLIEYGERHGYKFVDQNGNTVNKTEDPRGLSGSAIWKFNPETMNSENPEYSLWGIQNSWFEKSQVLCGAYIEPLIKQIINDYDIKW